MAAAISALDTLIKQEIAEGIREMRIEIDPVWSEIITTSMGVERKGLGREWKFLKTYTSGISGAYEFQTTAVRDGGTLTLDNASVKMFGLGNGWPTRGRSTAPSFPQSDISLVEARGNMFVPMQWLQLDEFDSSVGSAFKELLKGCAFKASLAHSIAFYTADADDFKVVDSLAVSSSASEHTITIDNADATKALGRIQMLHNGQLVDIYTSGDSAVNSDSEWVVTSVDYLNNKFNITKISGSDIAITAEDYITVVNSRGLQPEGLRSWMVTAASSTKVMDRTNGIDTGDHPEYGSLLVTESGPATEKILTKHIGTFDERVGTMCKLDTIITTAGVTHGYLENEDNLARYERNGRRLDIKGGWADIDYGYHGENFKWAISSYSEPKKIFVLKLGGGNIKEFVPPAIPGTGGYTDFSNEIQFVAQMGGATSIWLHERNSDAITDVLEAPFLRQCQLSPDKPQGIIISGLDETSSN